ncbi:MAG: phosphotransferase [Eubacteriales bacterium]
MTKKAINLKEKLKNQFKVIIKSVFPSLVYLIRFYISRKRIIRNFKFNKIYMINGDYIFDKTFNYIYLNNDFTSIKVSDLFDNGSKILAYKFTISKHIINYILIKSLSFKLKIKNNGEIEKKEFKGNIYLPNWDDNNFKIFDLYNKKILHIFTKKEAYLKKLFNYNHFNHYFNMPLIINKDENNLLIIEEYRDFKKYNSWNDCDFKIVMKDIFMKTIKYFSSIVGKLDYTLKTPINLLERKEDNFINDILNGINDALKNTNFPKILLHGDLWTSNILLDNKNKNVRYIDFELSKEFIFFYDIFYLMWSEFNIYKSHKFLEFLLSGEFDSYFALIFNMFRLNFTVQHKIDYLNIFFLSHYCEWLYKADKTTKQVFYNKYKMFMDFARNNFNIVP